MNLNRRKDIIFFSLAVETLMASYGLLAGQQTTIVSIIYLLSSLVFIVTILTVPDARLARTNEIKKDRLLKSTIGVIMLFSAFITSRYWLEHIPLDPDFADMLPIMKVMNERFLQGHWRQVYDPIPEIWNGTRPIYLPAMWLPYLPAIALKLDMRWITVIAVLFAFAIIGVLIRIRKNKYFGCGQIAISAILFWWIFSRNDVHGLISMSEEGVVILYFVFLTLAILSGNPFLMGITASLCMLSRYSMIGWLIPCMIYFISKKNLRKLLVFAVTGTACIILFFLLPFGSQTLGQMISLPGNYIVFAKHVWEYSSEVYWLNLGMAKFYGPHRMAALHYTLIILSFGIPVLFMCFCLIQKKWKLQNINLACFKLSLLVFYQFIDVPYGYLFYTCSFVSMVIAAVILREPQDGNSDLPLKHSAP
jgi:hypothetical protein